MEVSAKISSKGQVTLPKELRDALELRVGDRVTLRVEGSHALLSKTPHFLDLAGAVPVPAGKRGTPWDEVLHRARRERVR